MNYAPSRPRVLVLAFACNPSTGSEPEAGWRQVKALADVADLTVLVPTREIEKIRAVGAEHSDERIQFVEVALNGNRRGLMSKLVRFDRRVWFLRYLGWLGQAQFIAQRLHDEHRFDATCHASFGCYWLPSPLRHLDAPMMWGPAGGATRTAANLYKYLGWRGVIGEWQKIAILKAFTLLPSVRKAWSAADVPIAETRNSLTAMPRWVREKCRIINRGPLIDVPPVGPPDRKNYLLFASSVEARKGPRLALRALAKTPDDVRLIFVADGYEVPNLKRMAMKLGIADRVDFLGHIPRDEMYDMMNAAAIVLTGLREEGGSVLPEAMRMGTLIVILNAGCVDHIHSQGTDPSRVRLIDPASSDIEQDFADAMTELSHNPCTATGSYPSADSTVKDLQQALRDTIALNGVRTEVTSKAG